MSHVTLSNSDPASVLPPVQQHAAPVFLAGWGTAVPSFSVTQEAALAFVLDHFNVRPATQALYRKTFANPSVRKRHFALESLTDILDQDLDRVNQRFERAAVDLSTRSLRAAIAAANCSPADLDFLIVTTCTGYLCPGLSAYLVETCGLRRDIRLIDSVGMGCGAALPALQQARDVVLAHPGATAAVVGTEICSAAMFSNDAPDIVISNTIFADGSAAAILRSSVTSQETTGSPRLVDFESRLIPEWRDSLRFRTERGHLKNVLAKDVPERAATALNEIASTLLARHGLSTTSINHWILHAGGDAILNAATQKLNLAPDALNSGRWILENFGNMSSPTVLFVLEEELRRSSPKPGTFGILASFGAGFSAHAALVEF